MASRINRQVTLKSRPAGIPQASDFEIVETPVPALAPGQVLVRNVYLTAEPAMRGWVSAVANYSEPVPLGGVMRSPAVGRVTESRHPGFVEGEFVTGMFGWRLRGGRCGRHPAQGSRRRTADLDRSRGVGLNGLTAYFALLEVGQPKAGKRSSCRPPRGRWARASARSPGSRVAARSASPEGLQRRGSAGRIRIRRGHRLQGCGAGAGTRGSVPGRRRRLLRQHRRRNQRRRARATQTRCARGDLRHRVGVQLGPPAPRSAGRAPPPREAGAHAGIRHFRSRAALPRGPGRADRMAAGWPDPLSRGHARRNRACAGSIAGLYRGENLGKRIIRIAPESP